MKIRFSNFQNLLLAFGLSCILFGIYFLVYFSAKGSTGINIFLRFMCLSGFGMVILFSSIVFFKNYLLVFIGMNLVFFGILALVIDTNVLGLTLNELWPLLVVSCGLSLFPSGLYRTKRIKSVYLFPGIALFVLGLSFLPFSLRIIGLSFKKFASISLPIIVILLGLILVVVFFYQQSHKKDFPYMTDDSEIETRGAEGIGNARR